MSCTRCRPSRPVRTLAIGTGCGLALALAVYAFMPVGQASHAFVLALLPPVALLAAGVLADGLRQGVIAGLCAGGAAALLLATLTIATMVLLPGQADLVWANPDPSVPHGTLFELQMSVGDASVRYQVGLLLGPFAGLVFGFLGGSFSRPRPERVSEPVNAAPAG